MTTLTVKIPDKKAALIKQLLKELGATVVTKPEKEEESPYDPEYVAMIQKGEKDLKEGKGVKVDINNLWK